MTTGITVQSQGPGSAGTDIGFWLGGQVIGQPMAMTERALSYLVESIHANRFSLPRNRKNGARITEKGTAIVEIHGILIDRAPIIGSFWGLTSYEGLEEQFRRLASDAKVKRIILDIDSPGGLVRGIEACAEGLEKLAGKKPVHAIAHNMACSAGYWLACVAETVSITRNGEVGSIGVRAGHVSYAEMLDRAGMKVTMFGAGDTKTDGNPYEFLSDGEYAESMFEMERLYDGFVSHVAKHRPMNADDARETGARCFSGQDAIDMKLADRIENLEAMVERLEKEEPKPKRKSGAKTTSESGSERTPAKPDPSQPAAGSHTKTGAKLMSEQQTPAGGQDPTADNIARALVSIGLRPGAEAKSDAGKDAAADNADETARAVEAAEERIFAILESDEGKARPSLAIALAKERGLTADGAKALLAASPEELPAAKKSDDEGGDKASQLNNALANQMEKSGNSARVKPEANSDSGAADEDRFVKFVAKRNKKKAA